jgi:hypothetical protein
MLVGRRVDEAWTPTPPPVAMVFVCRRGAGRVPLGLPASPRAGGSVGGVALGTGVRGWSDRSGTFRVDAAATEVSDDRVLLLKRNGVRVAVPLERLCKADLHYLYRVGSAPTYDALLSLTSARPWGTGH